MTNSASRRRARLGLLPAPDGRIDAWDRCILLGVRAPVAITGPTAHPVVVARLRRRARLGLLPAPDGVLDRFDRYALLGVRVPGVTAVVPVESSAGPGGRVLVPSGRGRRL